MKSKPIITKRRRVSENAAMFRVRRHAEDNGLLVIHRSQAPCGPVFVVDVVSGRVVLKHVESHGALAQRLGLLKADEVAA